MGELALHPVVPFLLAAVVAWFAPRRVGNAALLTAPVVALVQLGQLEVGTTVPVHYLGFDLDVMRVDRLALPFAWVFAVAALIGAIYGLTSMHARERAAVLVYAGAAMGVVFAGDLLSLFFFWEIKAVASTFVILERRGGNSGRAGTRYLYTHLVGGKLLFGGALWYAAETGSLTFEAMTLSWPTALILLAFLLSAAVPPLHAWLPDAYPEASVAGTVFLSAFTTKAAVYALARGFPGTQLLIALGVAMALYGVVYAVLENDTRRLLGYHIVSQVGYMVAGIGIGTEAALNGATAHAFAHILYKGLLLMGAGAVLYATGRSKMTGLGGIANRMRPTLALYMIGAVSISSVPLFSGFVSKELVVDAASLSDLGWVVLLLKVASVGTFLHTGLKLPYGTWFGAEGWGPRDNGDHPIQVGRVAPSMYVAMAISAVLNTALGLFPGLLYRFMPYEVVYDPYTLGKVVEKSSILLFTALAFWLLLDQLGAKATVSLDVDWLYRGLPRLVGDHLPRLRPAFGAGRATTPAAVGARAGTRSSADDTTPAAVGATAGTHRAADDTSRAAAGATAGADEVASGTRPSSAGDVTGAPAAAAPAASVGLIAHTRALVQRRWRGLREPADGPPPVVATWLLGTVILVTSIVILTESLRA
jgi:multicomponent Na+:H+ antiporter subunit D